MASLPYMQFYPGEYLADTAHLTTEQHGAYLLLLFNYWQRGKALDNSNDRLTSVVRMSNDRWNENKQVLQEFFEVENNLWFHKRLERDLEAFRARLEQTREAGKASAAKRYKKLNGRSTVVGVGVERNVNDKIRQDKKRKEIYGTFKNVLLTNEEYDRLGAKYSTELPVMIEHLSEYIQRTGKAKTQDHNLVLQKWVLDAVLRERQERGGSAPSMTEIQNLPDLPPELAEEYTNGRK